MGKFFENCGRFFRCARRARSAFLWIFSGVFFVDGLSAGEVLVATWNLENYSLENRMTDAGYRKEYPKPEAQKDALREAIRELNADVLVFQEMGDERFARELRRDLKREGLSYDFAEVMGEGPRNLAVFSKRAFEARRHLVVEFPYFGKTERMKRGVLELFFGEWNFSLFTVHLKSRFTERNDDPNAALKRAGEAVAARDLVLKRFPNPAEGRFLVMGDFNDSRNSRAVRAFLDRGKLRISEYVPAVDSRGELWSYFYKKKEEYSRVDHAMVSPGLAKCVKGAGIFDGAAVLRAGDHRPLWVRLELK